MARSLALLALSSAATLAAATAVHAKVTVPVLLPMYGGRDPVASVIAADDKAYTLAVDCPTKAECNIPDGVTLTQGPSTYEVVYTTVNTDPRETYSMSMNCDLNPHANVAECTAQVKVQLAGHVSAMSTATKIPQYLEAMNTATITAGQEKIKATASAAKATHSVSSETAAATKTSGSSKASGSGSSSDSAKKTASSSSTASGNAAAAMVTQNAVLMGVAAMVGGAALL